MLIPPNSMPCVTEDAFPQTPTRHQVIKAVNEKTASAFFELVSIKMTHPVSIGTYLLHLEPLGTVAL